MTSASQRANCADVFLSQHRPVNIDQCKDSLHRTRDIRLITWFFRLVLWVPQRVPTCQLPVPCMDPLPRSDLSSVLALVDHHQQPKLATVLRSIRHKVVRPHIILVAGTVTHATVLTSAINPNTRCSQIWCIACLGAYFCLGVDVLI